MYDHKISWKRIIGYIELQEETMLYLSHISYYLNTITYL